MVHIPVKFLRKQLRDQAALLPTSSSRTMRIKAGDQHAENTFSVIKRNLLRLNLSRSTKKASLNFLASAWLQKNVGLEGIAKAMVIYQSEMITARANPAAMYKSTDWLRGLECIKSSA